MDRAPLVRDSIGALQDSECIVVLQCKRTSVPRTNSSYTAAQPAGCATTCAAATAACRTGAMPYSVVRWRGCRPAPRISSSMASAGSCWPWLAPAARVMLSFISTPPMSLQPAALGVHVEVRWWDRQGGAGNGCCMCSCAQLLVALRLLAHPTNLSCPDDNHWPGILLPNYCTTPCLTCQQLRGTLRPHLHPRGLDACDVRVQRQPRHGVHQHALAQRGAPT